MEKKLYEKALRLMLLSRFFEDKTEELFKKGLIHGTTHLANGQEASQAGLCLGLIDGDWIVPTHRCHGFTLCRGSSPYAMFSEMFGSKNGLAKGLGGSMHMPDKKRWNLGSSAVVGSGIPLATGVAFKLKRDGSNNISVAIFGDGATSRGSVHECMNLASIWGLPVLFYCENNLYGMSAPSSKMISISKLSDRAKSYNMKGQTVDGNDFEKVYKAVQSATNFIRKDKAPFFLEVLTYRTKGHSKSDKCVYRSPEEESFWALKDPIKQLEDKMKALGLFSDSSIKSLEDECLKYIEEQAEKALKDSKQRLTEQEALSFVYSYKMDY